MFDGILDGGDLVVFGLLFVILYLVGQIWNDWEEENEN